ncbi:hypothetical protein RUND412_000649 [Rhizina undulata]
MPSPNIWIAASDADIAAVGQFLAQDPSAANARDENGYTPIHAAASYNHISLLRSLVLNHGGDPNIQDSEGDTPLFVAETVEVAKTLVEELNADPNHRNISGQTAADAIEEDGQFPLVVAYLRGFETAESSILVDSISKPPPNVSVNLSTMEDTSETLPTVDDALRQRIEELASRANFSGEEAQAELRNLVTQAVHQHILDPELERNVRQRQGGDS